jgi:hypothetical protein
MDDPSIIPVWRAFFHCSYEVMIEALRHILIRLQRREPRPLAFGFTEAGDGSTFLDYQETQRDNGAFFVIKLVNWNQKTHQPHEENVGVILIYKGKPEKTKAELRCPLEQHGSHIDYEVEIAKYFASEARGYGVAVESDLLSTEFVRDFTVSATIIEMSRAFAVFNNELKTFGYWIDLPDQVSQETLTGAYTILKTDGANPYFSMKPYSPFWRHEVGAIEYLQIKAKTRLKIYASNFEERAHLWAYINILKEKMRSFGLIEETKPEARDAANVQVSSIPTSRNIGHPGLAREELIYRLMKAQEAEEIKQREPEMTWKEIARAVGWRFGNEPRGVKLLEDARHRLRRPENKALVDEIAMRRKERKERQ